MKPHLRNLRVQLHPVWLIAQITVVDVEGLIDRDDCTAERTGYATFSAVVGPISGACRGVLGVVL